MGFTIPISDFLTSSLSVPQQLLYNSEPFQCHPLLTRPLDPGTLFQERWRTERRGCWLRQQHGITKGQEAANPIGHKPRHCHRDILGKRSLGRKLQRHTKMYQTASQSTTGPKEAEEVTCKDCREVLSESQRAVAFGGRVGPRWGCSLGARERLPAKCDVLTWS